MTSYLNAMRNYATFSGRASRSEFWLFMLIVFVGILVGAVLDGALGFADEGAFVITGVWNLLHLLPSLAVSVRRLHDSDKSGWWMLIALTGIGQLLLLVFFCLSPTAGANRFGPNPLDPNAPQAPTRPYEAAQGVSAAHATQNPATAPANATGDTVAQIEKLSDLHKQGTIDDDEFAKMKADLLKKT